MKTIGMIGNFGSRIGGQTTKTNELYQALEKRYGFVNRADVQVLKKNAFAGIRQLVHLLRDSSDVIIILASPGYFKILPMLLAANIYYKRNFYEVVIGGVRDQYIQKKRYRLRWEKSIKKIYAESDDMVRRYQQLGLFQAVRLSNFKHLNIVTEAELREVFSDSSCGQGTKRPLRLCTFSRIDRWKGIDTAVSVVRFVNSSYGKSVARLDIFGPVDPDYEKEFCRLLCGGADDVKYGGILDTGMATGILKKYDALLFPTKWLTEGFPGTFMDAMAAGLPVLASERENFKGIIKNGCNGYLIRGDGNIQAYADKIYNWYENRDQLLTQKKNSLNEAEKYRADQVLMQIWKDIEAG